MEMPKDYVTREQRLAKQSITDEWVESIEARCDKMRSACIYAMLVIALGLLGVVVWSVF